MCSWIGTVEVCHSAHQDHHDLDHLDQDHGGTWSGPDWGPAGGPQSFMYQVRT